MKLLVPVDGAEAALAGVHHAIALQRYGVPAGLIGVAAVLWAVD